MPATERADYQQLPKARLPETSMEERAVRWIMQNHDMSYPQVAALFGVSANSIRSRIEYRYGSLATARHYAMTEGM